MPVPPAQALAEAQAVFRGTVVGLDEPSAGCGGTMSSADPVTVSFQVDEVWKGEVAVDQQLTTAVEGASCGFSFSEGKEYVVYARDGGADGGLNVSLCSRTRTVAEASEDLAALGKGDAPSPGEGGCRALGRRTGQLLPLLLVVVAIWGRRRQRTALRL